MPARKIVHLDKQRPRNHSLFGTYFRPVGFCGSEEIVWHSPKVPCERFSRGGSGGPPATPIACRPTFLLVALSTEDPETCPLT